MTAIKRPRLAQLNIRSLRGIVDLQLQLSSKSLVIQGANGHGKSSIADALEFCLLGTISHLEGRQSLSLAKYGKHVLAKDADVRVEIRLNDGGTLVRGFVGPPEIVGSTQLYVRGAERRTFLLRRFQLLAFIHADPADRFRELAALIGIASLDGLELALKRAADSVKGTLEADKQVANAHMAELSALTGLPPAGVTHMAVLEVVNARLIKLQRPQVESLDAASALATQFIDPAVISATTRDIISVEAAQRDAAKLMDERGVLERVDRISERIAAFQTRGEAKHADSLSRLVVEGARYFAEYAPAECPVCEQTIDVGIVAARLTARLQVLRELTDEASVLRVDSGAVATTLKAYGLRLNEFMKQHALLLDDKTRVHLDKAADFTKQASTRLGEKELLSEGGVPAGGEVLHDLVGASLHAVGEQLTARILLLKPSAEDAATAALMSNILRMQSLFRDLNLLAERVAHGTARTIRAKVALAELVAAKNEVVAEIYETIKADVDRFYDLLHPKELHTNVVLDVTRRASTGLWMDSFGLAQQDPRGFSSEGHLDSLGLCIFLAFANTFRGACSLLVLDDVIMSIDAGHRKRIADLLVSEFGDFQLIVTTHDRIWFQELTDAQKAQGRQAEFLNLQIRDWTVDGGPVLSNYSPSWERVMDRIKAGDLSGAGGDSRRNLEWTLQEIAEKIQATVPYQRDPRHTVEVLYQPVKQRLEKLIPAKATPAFKMLEGTKPFGNMMAHATATTEAFSREEVEEYANAVRGLHQCFCCDGCGALLHYDQPAKHVVCRNPKCTAKTLSNVS